MPSLETFRGGAFRFYPTGVSGDSRIQWAIMNENLAHQFTGPALEAVAQAIAIEFGNQRITGIMPASILLEDEEQTISPTASCDDGVTEETILLTTTAAALGKPLIVFSDLIKQQEGGCQCAIPEGERVLVVAPALSKNNLQVITNDWDLSCIGGIACACLVSEGERFAESQWQRTLLAAQRVETWQEGAHYVSLFYAVNAVCNVSEI